MNLVIANKTVQTIDYIFWQTIQIVSKSSWDHKTNIVLGFNNSNNKRDMRFGDLISVGLVWLIWLSGRACSQEQQAQVPCFFIFGDSLVDNGNNNDILSLARANYRPYGIDFPRGTTGRFTNGRTFVDILSNKTFSNVYYSMLNTVFFFFFYLLI